MSTNFQRLKSGQPWRVNEPTARAIIESAEWWNGHKTDGTPRGPLTPIDSPFRFRLEEDLASCGSALADVLVRDSQGNEAVFCTLTLTDVGAVAASLLFDIDSGGQLFIRAGTCGYGAYFHDALSYEPLCFRDCCQEGSSSSHSESEHSHSEHSHSEHSHSEHSHSEHSHSEHSKSEHSSSKSTAIVPATWSPSGYTKLFVAEMPEVRFDDVLCAQVAKGSSTLIPIDPRFVEVCEKGTIEVCGAVPDLPVAIGASISSPLPPGEGQGEGLFVRICAGGRGKGTVNVTLRLTGIRRGFKHLRFPDATREQFLANEHFYRMSQPKHRVLTEK